MSTQLLIYSRPTPVSHEQHGDWCMRPSGDFGFARHTNVVPLLATEFANASTEFAIVFAGTDTVTPAILLGARNDENLFVTESGSWDAKYRPAFIRRYPFVFAASEDGGSFTVCIDEEYAGWNQEGRGERLFDADGAHTQYLGRVLEFLKAYQIEFQRTQDFCARIVELELLQPVQAQFRLQNGEQLSLSGFQAIDRDRLKQLPADTLGELAKTDQLELAYLHLHSLRNVVALAERLPGSASVDTGTTEEGSEPTALDA